MHAVNKIAAAWAAVLLSPALLSPVLLSACKASTLATSSLQSSQSSQNSDQTNVSPSKPTATPGEPKTSTAGNNSQPDPLFPNRKHGWSEISTNDRHRADQFADRYIHHLNRGKTPRRFLTELAEIARSRGAADIRDNKNKNKTFGYRVEFGGDAGVFFRRGLAKVTEGLSIIVVSIDAPRLELKQFPTFESEGFGMLQTKLHGELEWRSWMVYPMALDIYLARPGHRPTSIVIGQAPNDVVLSIPDLLPHLSRGRGNVDHPERLDPIGAATPAALADRLAKLGVNSSDFAVAEAYLVPATRAHRIGVDRGLIGGYGQKNRALAFTAIRALADTKTPKHSIVVVVLGRSESKQPGRSGTSYVGRALRDTIAQLASAPAPDIYFTQQVLSASAAWVGTAVETGQNQGIALGLAKADALPGIGRKVSDMLDRANVQFHWIGKGRRSEYSARAIATLNLDALTVAIPSTGHGTPGQIISVLDLFQGYQACVAWFSASN